jgi:hypothetical protein
MARTHRLIAQNELILTRIELRKGLGCGGGYIHRISTGLQDRL